MPNELEDRLLRASADLPEPSPEAASRIRAAVVDTLPAGESRLRRVARRARRPVGILATAGAFGSIAALLGLLIVAGPSTDHATTRSLRPDLSSLSRVRLCSERRLRVPCVVGTPRVRAATPALHDAPWLYGSPGRIGSEPPRPSLIFPAGTTYAQAVDALYVSVVLTGGLPPGTTLGAPLPSGAVLLRPTNPSQGIALDLRAPLGYKPPQGMIYGFVYLGTPTGPLRGRLWLPGLRIAVPSLPKCMVVSSRTSLPPACGAKDEPTLRGLTGEPLPGVGVSAGLVEADSRESGPPLTLRTLRAADGVGPVGARVSLASLRGRVVVLGLLASWCEPCKKQARALDAIARDWRGEDVTVLGIAVNDLTSEARKFVSRYTFPALTDPKADALSALTGQAGASLPWTLLIDKKGHIALALAGKPRSDRLDQGVAELVAEVP